MSLSRLSIDPINMIILYLLFILSSDCEDKHSIPDTKMLISAMSKIKQFNNA